MLPATRFSSTISLATLAAFLSSASLAAADIEVAKPFADQYPRVAHTGKAFSWTFAESTFNTTDSSTLTYTAHGLPDWAHFDATTRTFSGTPTDDDEYTSAVAITAADSTSSTASDDFNLVVVSDPEPLLKSSLVQQLPTASSLGRSMILPGTKLHIPYGWSFSIGWQGDTFYLPSGDDVYTYGTINGYDPLPDWLHYSNSTYALWGIAPDQPQAEGVEFTFCLNGANAEGHAGTQTNVTIVLGRGRLSLAEQGMPTVNATVGAALNYSIPTSSIKIDGHALVNPSAVNITANLSNYTWLTFDNVTRTLSGTPPSDAAGADDSTTPVNGTVPLTITDSLGKSMTYDLPLMVYPPVFSAGTLPNVYVESGKAFNVSLAEYVRNAAQANITAAYNPTNASEWIKYDAATQVLSGTPPSLKASDKIQVTLESNAAANSASSTNAASKRSDASGPANQATFFVALNGTNPGTPSTGGNSGTGSGNSGGGGGGLSSKGRTILAAALGSAGGLILLAALILLARRCCAAEEHDTEGNMIDDGRSPALSDDRTLYGGASPVVGMAATKPMKVKEGASPATIVGSPYLDPNSAKQRADDGSELRGILIGGKTYGGPSPEMREAVAQDTPERPRQHGFMSALVTGAKKKFPSSRSLVKEAATNRAAASQSNSVGPSESMGLGLTGLGLEGASSNDPYTRRPAGGHSRSRASLRSSASKESWEEDLFYNSGEVGPTGYQGGTLNPIIEVDEVPRRRGQNGRISSRTGPMRHRNSHINASPAFTTPGTFAHPASDESSNGHLASMHGHDMPGSTDDFPTGPSENFVIETAQRVDVRGLGNGSVRTYQPHVQEQQQRSISSHANALGENGAFEDAEDEEQPAAYMATPSGKGRYRNSAMSAVTADSHLQAMSPYLSYPDPTPSTSMLAPQSGAPSPRAPSFFGGASIASGTRPEDTLRAVNSGPRINPPSPLAGQPAVPELPSNNPYAAVYSHLSNAQRVSPTRPSRVSVETLEASVSPGERVRIKLTPPGGAAMVGGAPGSPGKRSSRLGKYVPVLDDESMQAHGTWPLWLSEWLRWDPSMFELSGEVPLDFELSEVRIALVHRKSGHTDGSASGPGTPTADAHRRQRSSDSAATAVEDQVVARLWLYIDPPQRFDDGDGASSSGHGHVNLRREGAGTAF